VQGEPLYWLEVQVMVPGLASSEPWTSPVWLVRLGWSEPLS